MDIGYTLEPDVRKAAAYLRWDGANESHIARHGVSRAEAEEVVTGDSLSLLAEERNGEDRHTELGETHSGRLPLVGWAWRGCRIRVVTAFPAKREWRVFWRRLKGARDAEEEAG
jgi:uncharacterized DUF497 family protein